MKVYINDQPYLVTKVHYDSSGNRYVGIRCLSDYEYLDTRLHAFNMGKFWKQTKKNLGFLNKDSMKRLKSIRKNTADRLAKAKESSDKARKMLNASKNPTVRANLQKSLQHKQNAVNKLNNSQFNYKPTAGQKAANVTRKVTHGTANVAKETVRRTSNVLVGKKRFDAFKKNPSVGGALNIGWGATKRIGGTALAAGAVATGATLYGAKKVVGGVARAGGNAGRAIINGARPQPRNLNQEQYE